jgi:Mn-dependent DtxR family transcriptional regulator
MDHANEDGRRCWFPARWLRVLSQERVVLAVGAAISAHINSKTGTAWPSRAAIAEMVGTNEREVTRAIRRLRSLGLIDVEPGGGIRKGKEGKTSTYRLRELPNLGAENLGSKEPGYSSTPNLVAELPGERTKELYKRTLGAPDDSASVDPTLWQDEIRNAAKAIRKHSLSSLTADERFTVGRYHALEFANCTKSEATNKRKARQIAAGLCSLGQHRDYSDVTVGEYVTYAKKVHVNGAGAPWFDVWLIKGVVEFGGSASSPSPKPTAGSDRYTATGVSAELIELVRRSGFNGEAESEAARIVRQCGGEIGDARRVTYWLAHAHLAHEEHPVEYALAQAKRGEQLEDRARADADALIVACRTQPNGESTAAADLDFVIEDTQRKIREASESRMRGLRAASGVA